MKKSLETRMDEMYFHLNKAAELTAEWWQARTDMGRTMQTMDETTDFFMEVATQALRTERHYLSQIRYHRNKAKRIVRRYEKTPVSHTEMKIPQEKTELYDVASLYPEPYAPVSPSEPRN